MEKTIITADWHKLMEDGQNEAYMDLLDAIEKIDKKLGEGYAKTHPDLIGAYMNTASRATMGTVIGKCILELRNSIDELKVTIWNSFEHVSSKI